MLPLDKLIFKLWFMEEIRTCKYHGETEFRLETNGRWRCKKCMSEAVQKRREVLKLKAIKYKGGKCCICGYNNCVNALEFHHMDPNEKDFGIASDGYTRSWENVKEELDKCVLLCANHHREVHAGLIDKSLLLPNLDIKIEDCIVDGEYIPKKKEVKTCKVCGIEINSKSDYCRQHWLEKSRKVQWPSREELKMLIRNTSFVGIGRIYGVDGNSVKRWCIKYKLPYLKSEINKFSDEEWKNL